MQSVAEHKDKRQFVKFVYLMFANFIHAIIHHLPTWTINSILYNLSNMLVKTLNLFELILSTYMWTIKKKLNEVYEDFKNEIYW